ncbi:flavin reductase family protein [Candidatus Woesearchaeota archaeon]|nr:flavin reductase family protein [Candidatus Woesearchaeota archaeon]
MAIHDPRQLVLITCRGKAVVLGKARDAQDIIATSWHSPASQDPALYAVFVSNKLDFALNLLRHSRVFCVNFIVYELRAQAAFCARHAGEHIDKFKETELTGAECEKIDCPRIAEAVAHIECELQEDRTIGDHVLLVGKVVASEMKDARAKRLFQLGDAFTTTKD